MNHSFSWLELCSSLSAQVIIGKGIENFPQKIAGALAGGFTPQSFTGAVHFRSVSDYAVPSLHTEPAPTCNPHRHDHTGDRSRIAFFRSPGCTVS